jgi:hypothetical protein
MSGDWAREMAREDRAVDLALALGIERRDVARMLDEGLLVWVQTTYGEDIAWADGLGSYDEAVAAYRSFARVVPEELVIAEFTAAEVKGVTFNGQELSVDVSLRLTAPIDRLAIKGKP